MNYCLSRCLTTVGYNVGKLTGYRQLTNVYYGPYFGNVFFAGEDRMSLIPLGDVGEDAESGLGPGMSSRIPPEWVNMVDEIQYEMTRYCRF